MACLCRPLCWGRARTPPWRSPRSLPPPPPPPPSWPATWRATWAPRRRRPTCPPPWGCWPALNLNGGRRDCQDCQLSRLVPEDFCLNILNVVQLSVSVSSSSTIKLQKCLKNHSFMSQWSHQLNFKILIRQEVKLSLILLKWTTEHEVWISRAVGRGGRIMCPRLFKIVLK